MKKTAFLLLLLLSFTTSLAYSNTCSKMFELSDSEVTAQLYTKLKEQNNTYGTAYDNFIEVSNQYPVLNAAFKRHEVLKILLNLEAPMVSESLTKLLNSLTSSEKTASFSRDDLTEILKTHLKDTVPPSSIPRRIESFLRGAPNSLNKVLGEMTLSEVQLLMYGSDPLNPSSDSLLGQYIALTGAKTVVKSFSLGPDKPGQFGEPRLVVAVSEASFPEYMRLFSNAHFLAHYHTPNQGTLHTVHNGRMGSYGNLSNQLAPGIANGTILPQMLLSSSEANRATNFFKLASLDGAVAQGPWRLLDKDNASYCARGGYSSCTHWFGNIPIGDKRVVGYKFPGRVDQYADRDVPEGVQYKELTPYSLEGRSPQNAKLIEIVWKSPGHEQLSSVLGLESNNIAGEFASPGFVAVSLTAAAPVGRVPVVFLKTPDHTQDIDPDFNPQINAF
ncbi:MAG: hypothetical protein V4596_00840 [Bdellovibrionota bacterium]